MLSISTAPVLFMASSGVSALLAARIYQAVGLATFLATGSSLVADMAPEGRTGVYIVGLAGNRLGLPVSFAGVGFLVLIPGLAAGIQEIQKS